MGSTDYVTERILLGHLGWSGDVSKFLISYRTMRRYKRFGTLLAHVTLVAVISACEFEPAITPIVWENPIPPTFSVIPSILTPQPEPIPIPPTPLPLFDGTDSLDCAEPAGGDNHFGYCRIPGTQEFYVWGECKVSVQKASIQVSKL